MKKTKVKVVKKPTQKVKEVKRLTQSELLRLRVDDEKRKYAELEVAHVELSNMYSQLELKILALEYTIKTNQVKQTGDTKQEKQKRVSDLASSRESFVKSIKERLNLADKWGFNPKTGLIKEG